MASKAKQTIQIHGNSAARQPEGTSSDEAITRRVVSRPMDDRPKADIVAEEDALEEELRALLAQSRLDPRMQEAVIALSNPRNTTLVDVNLNRQIAGEFLRRYPAEGLANKHDPIYGRWADEQSARTAESFGLTDPEQSRPGDVVAERVPHTVAHEGVHRLQEELAFGSVLRVPRMQEVMSRYVGGLGYDAGLAMTNAWPGSEGGAYMLANDQQIYADREPWPGDMSERLNETAAIMLGLNNDARALQKLYPGQEVPPLPRRGHPTE